MSAAIAALIEVEILSNATEATKFVASSEVNSSALSAVLGTVVRVLNLVVVSVAATNASNSLHVSGVSSSVGNLAARVVMLVAEVIVVSTVVPGSKIVGPAAISVVLFVDVAVGVIAWGVAERVSFEADNVANISRGVLVALVANASLLLAVVFIVVTVDRVESDVDFARVVAPFVVDSFLGVPMVVGSPLVPGVVNPLVVALTLVASSSLGVVGIDSAATLAVTVTTLVTVVLVIGTIALNIRVVVLVPGLHCDDGSSEKDRSEHVSVLKLSKDDDFSSYK